MITPAFQLRCLLGALVLALASLTIVSTAQAIPPAFVPDEELAKTPVIVVAKWAKTPVTAHNKVEGDTAKELECRTELVIERVIPPGNKPFAGKMVDITMMVMTGAESAQPRSTAG